MDAGSPARLHVALGSRLVEGSFVEEAEAVFRVAAVGRGLPRSGTVGRERVHVVLAEAAAHVLLRVGRVDDRVDEGLVGVHVGRGEARCVRSRCCCARLGCHALQVHERLVEGQESGLVSSPVIGGVREGGGCLGTHRVVQQALE